MSRPKRERSEEDRVIRPKKSKTHSMVLSEEQNKIVRADPDWKMICVNAAPGSGKTTTLIARVRFLMTDCNVLPEQIACVTYSRALAKDIEGELGRLCTPNTLKKIFFVGTIDALAMKLLARYDPAFVCLHPEDIVACFDVDRASPHAEFTHLFVDESQDMNRSRSEILMGLLDKDPNKKSFFVGDPRQTIYRGLFGASPEFMSQIVDRFRSHEKDRVLTRNLTLTRRMSPELVDFVNSAFPLFENQPPMTSSRPRSRLSGVRLVLAHAKYGCSGSKNADAIDYVVRRVCDWSREGNPGEVMILFPSVKFSSEETINVLRNGLESRNVPVHFNGGYHACDSVASQASGPDLTSPQPDKVYVGTVHSAKGRERKKVILLNFFLGGGAYRDDSPDLLSQMFVACTRASDQLDIVENCYWPERNARAPILTRADKNTYSIVKIYESSRLGQRFGEKSARAEQDEQSPPLLFRGKGVESEFLSEQMLESDCEWELVSRHNDKEKVLALSLDQHMRGITERWPMVRRTLSKEMSPSLHQQDVVDDFETVETSEKESIPEKICVNDSDLYHTFLRAVFFDATAPGRETKNSALANCINSPLPLNDSHTLELVKRFVTRSDVSRVTIPDSSLDWFGWTTSGLATFVKDRVPISSKDSEEEKARKLGRSIFSAKEQKGTKFNLLLLDPGSEFTRHIEAMLKSTANIPINLTLESLDDPQGESIIQERVSLIWNLVLLSAFHKRSLGIYWIDRHRVTPTDLLPRDCLSWTSYYKKIQDRIASCCFADDIRQAAKHPFSPLSPCASPDLVDRTPYANVAPPTSAYLVDGIWVPVDLVAIERPKGKRCIVLTQTHSLVASDLLRARLVMTAFSLKKGKQTDCASFFLRSEVGVSAQARWPIVSIARLDYKQGVSIYRIPLPLPEQENDRTDKLCRLLLHPSLTKLIAKKRD